MAFVDRERKGNEEVRKGEEAARGMATTELLLCCLEGTQVAHGMLAQREREEQGVAADDRNRFGTNCAFVVRVALAY